MSLESTRIALELLDSVIPEKTIADYLKSRPAVAAEMAEYAISPKQVAQTPTKKKIVVGAQNAILAAGMQKEMELPRVAKDERSSKFPAARRNLLGKLPVAHSDDSFEYFLVHTGLRLSKEDVKKIRSLEVDVEHQAQFLQFYRSFRSDLAKEEGGDEISPSERSTRKISAMDMFSNILVKPPHPDEEEEDIVKVKAADKVAESAFARPMSPPTEFHEPYDSADKIPDDCLRFIKACDAHSSLSLASAFESLPKALVAKNLGHAHLDALAAAAGDVLVSVEIEDGQDWEGWPAVFTKLKMSKASLKRVAFRNCSPGINAHLGALSELLKELSNVDTLELSQTKLSAADMNALVDGLAVARLKSVNLVNCSLGKSEANDEAALAVAQLISGSVTLKNVEIGENFFGSSGLVAIAQALKTSYLESFSLSGNFCRDMRSFCEALRDRAETVTSIDLSLTGIDHFSLAKLETSVLQGPALKRLNLDGNRLIHPQAQASLIRIVLASKELEISCSSPKMDEAPAEKLGERTPLTDRKGFRRLLSLWVMGGSHKDLLKGMFASFVLSDAQILSLAEHARSHHLTLFIKEVFDRPQLQLVLLRQTLALKESLDIETLRLLRRFSCLNPTGSLVLEDADDERLLKWAQSQPSAEITGKSVRFPEFPRDQRRALTNTEVERLRPVMKIELINAILRQTAPFLQITSEQVLALVSELQNAPAVAKLVASLWGSLDEANKSALLATIFNNRAQFPKEVPITVFETLVDIDWLSWGLNETTRNFDISLNLTRPSHRRLLTNLVSLEEFVVFMFLMVDGVKTSAIPEGWKSAVPTQGKVSFRLSGKTGEIDEAKMKEARIKAALNHRSTASN